MINLYAMRRANGDWYALGDKGHFRVPLFRSGGEAMIARSRDTGMECFRPVLIDAVALEQLATTDEGKACYWLVEDSEMKLSRGRPLDHSQLARLVNEDAGTVRR
jgi:hypothetical protein